MKLSLKLRDDDYQNHYQSPLLRAKIPITIFNFPFLSGISSGDTSDLSFSLRTNFTSGPSLQFSYHPNSSCSPLINHNPPFIISLKSGIGLFGSPHNSPLIITAQFNLFANPNPYPTFSLQIKPQFGDFSLKKTAVSAPFPNPNLITNFDIPKVNGNAHSNGSLGWRDLRLDSCNKDGILKGIAVMARTGLPVTKRLAVKFRWGVNFPADFGKATKLPFLTVNKIGLERLDEEDVTKKKSITESNVGEVEILKSMCCWMRRDLEVMQKENKELKQTLEKIRLRGLESAENKSSPFVEKSSKFEQWRSKKHGGEEDAPRESKKSFNRECDDTQKESKKPLRANDVENELQRAIKAATS